MTAIQPLTLVLWGQGFDEIAASVFVAELRKLGKRVKLVGLNHKSLTGQYGVTLVPDLSLGQALRSASALQCLIVPAPLVALQQFSYDPRIAELLELVSHQQVLVVADLHAFVTQTREMRPGDTLSGDLLSRPVASSDDHHPHLAYITPFAPLLLLGYPTSEELFAFVKTALLPRLA